MMDDQKSSVDFTNTGLLNLVLASMVDGFIAMCIEELRNLLTIG